MLTDIFLFNIKRFRTNNYFVEKKINYIYSKVNTFHVENSILIKMYFIFCVYMINRYQYIPYPFKNKYTHTYKLSIIQLKILLTIFI